MKYIGFFLLITTLCNTRCLAQNLLEDDLAQNERVVKPLGLSTGLSLSIGKEYGFYKFQGDYFFTSKINMEWNAYYDPSGGGGLTLGPSYYFISRKVKKVIPFTGINLGALDNKFVAQVPLGVSFMTKKGFQAKFDLNGYFSPTNEESGILTELVVGWRF
ncbi:hypothetical protein LAG90_01940 [Marinilongibacter aquaticus]|uniref:hypothetical protein n=1 Tax=Marinilongibacter aquaticus TaxID=2975157 RepID=UPI0021BD7C6F|nr:hypothetical protein [Marinilongibacter aquaticus]UBM59418.1 hypothetical protein LAG90_01940 [Marinilongibacter aquaticus]